MKVYRIIKLKHVLGGIAVSVFAVFIAVFAISKIATSGQSVKANVVPVLDWGLNYQKDGTAPIGNAKPEYLRQLDSYYVVNTDEKVVFLTFDAGFEAGYTDSILDTLKKHEVPATFFLVGNYMETSAPLVKRMVSEGHIVANHTYYHPNMSNISEFGAFKKEIDALEKYYTEITGQELGKFYRPPEGKYSENNLKHAKELGYQTIFWSLAYVDWYADNQPTREQAFSKLLPRIHPGAIVLLHSTSRTNSEILDELLTKWKEQGYFFASLNDLEKYSK